MRRILSLLVLSSFLAVLAFAVFPEDPKVEVPVLPMERDRFGGRPGSFHFVTNEQAMADAAQLKEAFAALERLERSRASAGNSSGPEQRDLKTLRSFLVSVQAQRSDSAGETARAVEQHLNAAKGKFMCGGCHGHGMMRGGMPGR